MGDKILYSLPFFSDAIKLFVCLVGFSSSGMYCWKLNFSVVFHWPFYCLLGNICKAINTTIFSSTIESIWRLAFHAIHFECLQLMQRIRCSILTCDIKMPGSCAPNGTHEWSVPPMMLNPSDPLFFGRMTSCKWATRRRKKERKT